MEASEPKHARLAPSNGRWPWCAGSAREEAVYPDIAGDAAIDGTGSHMLLELCLNQRRRAESFIGETIGVNHEDKPNGWNVQRDRADRVQQCLDYINTRYAALVEEFPGHKIVVASERKSDPGGMFGRDDWWGTCDVTITVINDHDRCVFMEVIDYKDGRMWVGAKGNTQLVSYMIGQLRPFIASGPDLVRPHEWHKVSNDCRLTIVQPKTNPSVRSEDLTSKEIADWAEFLSLAAIATDDPSASLTPDSKGGKGHCMWCKHKDNCTALAGRDVEKLKVMTTSTNIETTQQLPDMYSFSEQLMKDAVTMPVEKLTDLIDLEPGIMAVFDLAKKEIERRVKIEPGSVPGWAMRPGKGSQVFIESDEKIAKTLKGKRLKLDFIFPKKLVTPAAIIKNKEIPKAMRDKIKKELIVFKAGKDTLQRVDVSRQKETAKEMFDVSEVEVDFNEPAVPELTFF